MAGIPIAIGTKSLLGDKTLPICAVKQASTKIELKPKKNYYQ